MSGLTRREALLGALALAAAGCGGSGAARGSHGAAGRGPHGPGSTLVGTWADPDGSGTLVRGPGEPLLTRTELGTARRPTAVLATLGHLSDAHVIDASSPARVPFLDRLGTPFQSTFRPQEALTAQVLAGAVASLRALAPDAVVQGGDLIDNAQANELEWAVAALGGGRIATGRYVGAQLASDPDPLYYRPDIDAPRHPGLLSAAGAPLTSPGLAAPWHPVLGDHDILVAGELPPDATTQRLAVGDRALWELPAGLHVPPGVALTRGGSPDGPPLPGAINGLLAEALAGPTVTVPARAGRRELAAAEAVERLRTAAAAAVERLRTAAAAAERRRMPETGATLDYAVDVGRHVRLIVLDLARRGGGSGGLVRPEQPAWLAGQLAAAGSRWVIVASHQPLADSEGGEALLALLDGHPHVLAALAGHTHHNRIAPRATPAGGYWLVETASLIDYPQQSRAIRVLATEGGGAALQTWMLDHTGPGPLGAISRQLAYLDAQGGRPGGFAGGRSDRNAVLYRAAA